MKSDPSYDINHFKDVQKRIIHFHRKVNAFLCLLSGSDRWPLAVREIQGEKGGWFFNRAAHEIQRAKDGWWQISINRHKKENSIKWNDYYLGIQKMAKIEEERDQHLKFAEIIEQILTFYLFIFRLQENRKIYFILCDEEDRIKIAASETEEEITRYGKIMFSSIEEDPPEVLYFIILREFCNLIEPMVIDDLALKGVETAREGDKSKVRDFLEKVGNINWTDWNGWTMLHHAANQGFFVVIKMLITLEVDTEVKEEMSMRKPIHIAARQGNIVAIEMLINAGSNVNDTDSLGWTPLHYAAWKGESRTVEYLLSKNADVNVMEAYSTKKPIHVAVTEGHTEIVQIFLDNGADIDDVDEEGRSLLYHSVLNGCLEMTKFLIDRKAKVDCANKYGEMPIHVSTACDCVEIAELLLKLGADIECQDDDGWTPLHWAGYNEAVKLSQLFAERGASLSVKDNKGKTPFDVSVDSQRLQTASNIAEKMIQMLQDKGKYDDVLQIYNKLFELQKDKLGEDDIETLKTQTNIALTLSKLERYELALETFEIILNKTQSNINSSCTQLEMGRVYLAQWKLAEAMQIFKEVYNIFQDSLGTSDSRTLGVAREIAFVHFKRGEYDEASKLFENIYQKRKLSSETNDPETLQALQDLAMALAHKGENRRALGLFKEVLAKRKDILGDDHRDTLITGYHILMVEERLESSSTEKWSCCLQ